MAVGTHWEWRAFGPLSLELILKTAGALEKHFGRDDAGWELTDEYLWTPGCDVNVKLREDKLKFKRLLERRDDGCELWTEEADETFPFPLADEAVGFIRDRMKVEPPSDFKAGRESLAGFRASFSQFQPEVHLIGVKKHRIQYDLEASGRPLLIEIAEIQAPVRIWSAAIEAENVRGEEGIDEVLADASRQAILEAREQLNLPGSMSEQGYLQILEEWI